MSTRMTSSIRLGRSGYMRVQGLGCKPVLGRLCVVGIYRFVSCRFSGTK